MSSMLTQSIRSRWFALGVHAGLWLLLYLAVKQLGGKAPEFRDISAFSVPPQNPVPVAGLNKLFAPDQLRPPAPATNSFNPFFTTFFVPPPTPAPPPPPTTKKVEFVYQGFYQGQDAPRQVLVKVADALLITRIGLPVATNLYVAEATMQSLLLTNATGQTNLLQLNAKKEIEVPIK